MNPFKHILSRIHPTTLNDTPIGHLRQDPEKRTWTGQATLAGSERITIRIHARNREPSTPQRILFLELIRRYDNLRPMLAAHLFHAYERIRTSHGSELQKLSTSTDIWSIAHLSTVELYAHRSIDLALLYKIDWPDPDHVLTVTLKDWQVTSTDKDG